MNTLKTKKASYVRDIHLTGEYIRHFKPEDKWNPFIKIYKQKKQDAIDIINESTRAKTVLDAGGGMGRLSLALAKSAQNRIVLTDISIHMLKLVAEDAGRLNNIELMNADAHQLPFRDKSFDCIVGLDLLCHLVNPEMALREFHRILTNGGMLILDSTNNNPLWTLFYPRYLGKNPLNWLKTMRFQGVLPGWEKIVRHYPKNKFISLLQEMGFQVIRELKYGPVICPKWHLAVSRKVI